MLFDVEVYMSKEDLELLITLDDPGEDDLEEDTSRDIQEFRSGKDHPVMTSQAKKANDKLGQFALGLSRNTLTKSAPKTIRSIDSATRAPACPSALPRKL